MRSRKKKNSFRQLVCMICAIIILAGGLYVAYWYGNKYRIEKKSDEYSSLYTPTGGTAAPAPTAAPTQEPTPQPATAPTQAPLPDVVDVPIPTPDSETIVYTLPTPPPVQESFAELLALNSETIGFLRIDELISLPVVQRENDNEYYLSHSFEKTEAREGALFLDGMNRLVPEDDCLIVYGHNMMNDTMFGLIDHYDDQEFLQAHPLVHFDTIYENRVYAPIAAFPASMNPDSGSYFDVRQFLFDSSQSFDLFLSCVKSRSALDIPIDAYFGDRILLLVTCNYTNDDGRFIVVLRELRSAETEEEVIKKITGVPVGLEPTADNSAEPSADSEISPEGSAPQNTPAASDANPA